MKHEDHTRSILIERHKDLKEKVRALYKLKAKQQDESTRKFNNLIHDCIDNRVDDFRTFVMKSDWGVETYNKLVEEGIIEPISPIRV